jgi:pimeloyl-ACP methyl ester carboxylesterase
MVMADDHISDHNTDHITDHNTDHNTDRAATVGYGTGFRPEWWRDVVRDRHPVDGSPVFELTPARLREAGTAGREPLLLLHGVGNSGAIFSPVMPSLAGLGPVVAPTLSPELISDGDVVRRELPTRLIDWLGELSPPPWRIVAHSMGGILTGLLLRTRPDVVAGAVLLNSPLPSAVERLRSGDTLDRTGRALLALKGLARVTQFGRPRLPRFLRGAELAVVRAALRGFVYDPTALDGRVISRAILSSRTTDGVDFLRLGRELPLWESEPFDDVPVRIVLGADDPLVPATDLAVVGASYPGAEITVLERCGHFAHLEWPAPVVTTITEFFERVG